MAYETWGETYWPLIVDTETARKASQQGIWGCIACAALLVSKDTTFSISRLAYPFVFFVISWGIYKMSRMATIAGLFLFVYGTIYVLYHSGHFEWLFTVFVTLTFMNSVRAMFAYHELISLSSHKDEFFMAFLKWCKSLIWPSIADADTAWNASKQGLWACAFCAIYFTMSVLNNKALNSKFDMSNFIDPVAFIIIGWGIYKMNRIAPTVGVVLYIIYVIQSLYNSRTPNALDALITLMFINSIRGIFTYHKFISITSHKYKFFMAFLKWCRSLIWPLVADAETARKASKQGLWANALFAILTIIHDLNVQALSSKFDIWLIVDPVTFIVIGWGIYKMHRIAATAGLFYYIYITIYSSNNIWPPNAIDVFVTLMFINSIRAMFAYHEFLSISSHKDKFFMAFLKWCKATIWPSITDMATARNASKQGLWACALCESIIIISALDVQELNSQFDMRNIINLLIFIVIGWGIYKMHRIAATAGLFYCIYMGIYSLYNSLTPNVLDVFIALMFINAVRGIFACHEFINLSSRKNGNL